MNDGCAGGSRFQSIFSRLARDERTEQRPLAPGAVLFAKQFLAGAGLALELRAPIVAQQARHHVDDARRVQDVNRRLAVLGRDLHRGVLRARGRAANQQRQTHLPALHLLGDEHHLVKRRRDEAAQPDEIRFLINRRLQDLVRRHHDAEIDDVVAVAAEHDADDVLADVVHVPLDGRHHDLVFGFLRLAPPFSMNGCRQATARIHRARS
jgi:hypothetical protein